MNIHKLKQIVSHLENNLDVVEGSQSATAELLTTFGMSLDNWFVEAVQSLGGDTSTIIRNNETGLEIALNDIILGKETSNYHFDYISEIPYS